MASLSQGYDAKVDVVYQVVKNLLCKLRSRNNRRAWLSRGKINKISAYRDIERRSSVIHCTRSRQTTLPAALGDRYSTQRTLREAQHAQVVVGEKMTRVKSCVLKSKYRGQKQRASSSWWRRQEEKHKRKHVTRKDKYHVVVVEGRFALTIILLSNPKHDSSSQPGQTNCEEMDFRSHSFSVRGGLTTLAVVFVNARRHTTSNPISVRFARCES